MRVEIQYSCTTGILFIHESHRPTAAPLTPLTTDGMQLLPDMATFQGLGFRV